MTDESFKSLPGGSDPWTVLGLPVGACDADVRAAYLRKVRQYPPERAPEEIPVDFNGATGATPSPTDPEP